MARQSIPGVPEISLSPPFLLVKRDFKGAVRRSPGLVLAIRCQQQWLGASARDAGRDSSSFDHAPSKGGNYAFGERKPIVMSVLGTLAFSFSFLFLFFFSYCITYFLLAVSYIANQAER
jgi:hypothetical protein